MINNMIGWYILGVIFISYIVYIGIKEKHMFQILNK